jgi:stress response protein YsnF
MSDPAARQPKPSATQGVEAAEVAVGETRTIPVVEETARIEKRAVETGRVRVSTRTETVDQVLRESLRSDTVEVTRVPVDRTLSEGEVPPAVREEDGVTIIPVLEEILVVEKRLVLKEGVHVRRSRAAEDVEVPVTLRRQHAVVERVSLDGPASEQIDPLSDQETTP